MKKLFFAGLVVGCSFLPFGASLAGIVDTKHNLSVDSGNDIHAKTETQVCVFCHIPHNASPAAPLWNREDPGQTYTPYYSSTFDTSAIDPAYDQPTGDSLLCLSCHDGTIALGDLLSEEVPIEMADGVTTLPAERRSNLGTDLSDDHPVSFVYSQALADSDGHLIAPSELPETVKLDRYGQMQCTSCHDPHDNTNGDFLVMDAVEGALCEACHTNLHDNTPHKYSTAKWDGVGVDPWPNTNPDWTTVQDHACFNCHTPHAAARPERLLKQATEEDVCLVCHNSHVADSDIFTALQKTSAHPVISYLDEHDPTEDVLVDPRHVECQDCHNGHTAQPDTGDLEPSGTLTGVAGIDIDGGEVDSVSHEYQLCFRCHADTEYLTNEPVLTSRLVADEPNLRYDFQPSNPSFHPVAETGVSDDVPSLIPPLTEESVIKCTDCHNDNSLDSTARGPHGSDFMPILERQYETADYTTESATAYALCYKCHDRTSILSNQSFPKHHKHLNEQAPCNACHAPHGVRPDPNGLHSGTHLVNFDLEIVTPNSAGLLYFEDTGGVTGKCYLSCHDKDHHGCSYQNCKGTE